MHFSLLNIIKINTWSVPDITQEETAVEVSRSSSSGGSNQTPLGASGSESNRSASSVDTSIQVRPGQDFVRDGLTDERFIAEVNVNPEQKKRKLEDIHSTHDFSKMKIDECELIKLKRIARNDLCPKVNFLRGEDNSNMGTRTNVMKSLKTRPVAGKVMISQMSIRRRVTKWKF